MASLTPRESSPWRWDLVCGNTEFVFTWSADSIVLHKSLKQSTLWRANLPGPAYVAEIRSLSLFDGLGSVLEDSCDVDPLTATLECADAIQAVKSLCVRLCPWHVRYRLVPALTPYSPAQPIGMDSFTHQKRLWVEYLEESGVS